MYSAKGQRTKDHFIKVSAHLFNTQGYAGTSISEILDSAGYSKGALYRVFKDKDELAVSAFHYNYGIVKKRLIATVQDIEDDIDRILAVPRFYGNLKDEASLLEGGCPILNTAIEADDTHPFLKALTRKAFKEMAQLIEHTIAIAKDNKAIKASVNPKELANFMVATIEGSIALMKSMDNNTVMKQNMNQLETAILKML